MPYCQEFEIKMYFAKYRITYFLFGTTLLIRLGVKLQLFHKDTFKVYHRQNQQKETANAQNSNQTFISVLMRY